MAGEDVMKSKFQPKDFLLESRKIGDYDPSGKVLEWRYARSFIDENGEWVALGGIRLHFLCMDDGVVRDVLWYRDITVRCKVLFSRCCGRDIFLVCKSVRCEGSVIEGFDSIDKDELIERVKRLL